MYSLGDYYLEFDYLVMPRFEHLPIYKRSFKLLDKGFSNKDAKN